jgi:hypothetical protein
MLNSIGNTEAVTVSRALRHSSLGLAAALTSRSFASFDDLIRHRQQRRWNGEAESLGGLEVDEEFVLGGLLDGQVGGLGAFENLVHIGSGATNKSAMLVHRP